MLISPTTFYSENLKGKSKEEIISVIRRLKISITKLKKAIADPDLEALVCPSNELTLEYTRTYLEEAIIALNAVGGEYVPTKAELRSEEFDENISKIKEDLEPFRKESPTIDYAIKNNIISTGSNQIDPVIIGEADIVVFALYPQIFIQWLEDHQQYLKPGAILTDVTGVKCSVVYRVQEMLRDDVEFIAAHPMAGKEVYGIENSDETIFQKANYIVTPTEKNTMTTAVISQSL